MIIWSICWNFWKWVFKIWVFDINSMFKPILYFFKYNWITLTALEHASCVNTVHVSYRLLFSLYIYFFALTASDAVYLWVFFFFFFLLSLFCLSYSNLSIMVRKTRAHRTSTSFSSPSFDSEKFLSEENQETYEKLNFLRFVWVERKVILDELDLEIRRNFERRVWLPLVDIDHPSLATLIREFYSNLFVHSNDSNTQFVRTWI